MTKQTQKAIKEKAENFDKLAAQLLPEFNAVKEMTDRIEQGDFDILLKDIASVQDLMLKIRFALNYRPQKCQHGEANHWGDYVLPGDSRAYYYNGGE